MEFAIVSLAPVANLSPLSTALAKLVEKFATDVDDTGGKFAAGVIHTCGNFAAGIIDTGGAPWLANIFANFQKKIETVQMEFSGSGGKLSHEKTRSKKYCDTVPLNV